jgi:nickel-dependent lactate racemase
VKTLSSQNIRIPTYEWYGDTYSELDFPECWKVHEQHMAGHDTKPLSSNEISEKLQNPIGSPTLKELSKGKRRCVIIFDDMTRPTKICQMLPAVLDELHKGDIKDDKITFIMATGAHGARMLADFIKKLGEEIVERFLVFNHNPYENLIDLGETSYGTPVKINKEVNNCDLKIAIGSLMPHFGYGFGGGAKMVLPGVAGIDSIWRNHVLNKGVGPGKVQENIRRLDAEEAARKVNLDFVVNAIINQHRDVVDLVCGDVVDAHREGVKRGRKHYATPVVQDADISIGNGYPMTNEGYKAYHISVESVKKDGDLVFLLFNSEGSRIHYYNGRFGKDYGGLGWKPDIYIRKPWKMSRIIVVSPQLMKADEKYYGEDSTWVKSWKKARTLLKKSNDFDMKVALYPYATMQISERNAFIE